MTGHAKIELYKAGKIVRKVEKNNFITKAGKRFWTSLALSTLGYFIGNNESRLINFNEARYFDQITLTDNTIQIPMSNSIMPGNIVGFATTDAYSGADTMRGSINLVESNYVYSQNKLKLVFDFPTHAANGAFQTLGFTTNAAKMYATFRQAFTNMSVNAGTIADNYFYFFSGAKFYKYGILDGTLTPLADGLTSYAASAIYNNGKIYYDFGLYIYQYDIATNVHSLFYTDSLYNQSQSLFIYDNHIFSIRYWNNYYVWRKLTFAGQPVAEIPVTVNEILGKYIQYNPGWLYSSEKKWELNIANRIAGTSTTRNNVIPSIDQSITKLLARYNDFPIMSQNEPSPLINWSSWNTTSHNTTGIAEFANAGTCIVLDNPVEKNSEQTMKITYTFNVTMP